MKKSAPPRRAPLAPSDEAFALVCKANGSNAKGKNRRQLVGVARVRVVAIDGEAVRVAVLMADPSYLVGRELEMRRAELYAASDRAEHRAFGREIERFWGAPL